MKKLISVFAALALVGSLAAQKGKKAPAKAPAAPAVAAPKAPAMPAAVTAAPAAASAAKGMGLFIDLRGSYTFSNGSTSALADGTTSATGNADSITYKSSSTQGFGGGVSIGYDIAANLGLVASYDIRSLKTREWSGRLSDFNSALSALGGSTSSGTLSQKWTNQIIGIGFRPHVNALGGEWFAGAGLAIVLPFETTQTLTVASPSATWTAATNSATTLTTVKGYNIAYGAYAELGYKFMFTDNIGLNLGLRALVATVNNIDKTAVTTVANSGTGTANMASSQTTTYKESYSGAQQTTEQSADTVNATKKLASWETFGVTDFQATAGISLKF